MNPVHSGVEGIVMGHKCDVVVVMVGGEDKHMVPIKNSYVAIILMASGVSVWFHFKFGAVLLKFVKLVKSAGSQWVKAL